VTWDSALQPLTEDECLALLGQAHYGRVVVVTAEGRPEIFPVNFVLHGRTVAFRTSSPTILGRAPLGHVVFEADHVDASTHEGWDVVVSGEGADITGSVDANSVQARAEQLEPWAPGQKDHWVAIVGPTFHGRRLYIPAPPPQYF
jgi:nitroimidazol reductase NimA-like FMN-containing flavoprotein (pyridoxamine 5'-phosphate oxidase superfamily)